MVIRDVLNPHLAQRILTAYPEKIRLLYVRIPGSAGEHFLDTVRTMHPIFPDHIATPSPRLQPDFFRALGLMLNRFLSTRTVMLVQPRLPPPTTCPRRPSPHSPPSRPP